MGNPLNIQLLQFLSIDEFSKKYLNYFPSNKVNLALGTIQYLKCLAGQQTLGYMDFARTAWEAYYFSHTTNPYNSIDRFKTCGNTLKATKDFDIAMINSALKSITKPV